MTGFADRVLDDLGPTFRERAGALLPNLIGGLTGPLDEVDTLARPAAEDRPWASVFDLEHTTMPGWVGSVIGTTIPAGLDLEGQRAYVRDQAAWRRGRLDAVAAAVRTLLTGEQHIEIKERLDGDAWRISIRVYDHETTATADQIKAAAASQKPVGLLIDSVTIAPLITFGDFEELYGTFGDAEDEYDTYGDVDDAVDEDLPGTSWHRPAGHFLRLARLPLIAATCEDLLELFPTCRDLRDYDPTQEA